MFTFHIDLCKEPAQKVDTTKLKEIYWKYDSINCNMAGVEIDINEKKKKHMNGMMKDKYRNKNYKSLQIKINTCEIGFNYLDICRTMQYLVKINYSSIVIG